MMNQLRDKSRQDGLSAPPLHKSRARLAAEEAIARGDDKATALIRLVAAHDGLSVEELFHHTRSQAPIAATRQLAMYLMNVALERNFTDIGAFFGRDRTTVAHACARIEDLRDDSAFDKSVTDLEERLEAVCADRALLRAVARGGANEA